MKRLKSLLLTASALLACGAAAYDLDWHTVDGGGVSFISDGVYTLGGTAGQADAGELDNGTYNLALGFWGVVRSIPGPAITGITAELNPVKTGVADTLTASVTPATGLPLAFTWDFGDGGTGAGNPAPYTYALAGTFNAAVKVTDGFNVATSSLAVTAFAPASGSAPGDNPSTGSTVTNPLDNVGIKVVSSEGGVLEMQVVFSGAAPASVTVKTTIEGVNGVVATISGSKPVFKFTESGIFVVTSTVTDETGKVIGEAKITVPVGAGETGAAGGGTLIAPASKAITVTGLKGKFLFRESKPDIVSFKGTLELPGGLTVPKEYTWSVSAGNVFDNVTVDAKGKGRVPTTKGRVTKMQVKYPKLKKPATVTSAGMKAQVGFTFSVPDLEALGFGTEGISASVRPDEETLKSVLRSIQVAMVVAGTAYRGVASVDFKRSKNKDTGQFLPSRSGR